MQTQLQRVEIEAVRRGNDDFSVHDTLRGQLCDERFVQLGEVSIERLEVPALDVDIVRAAKNNPAEAVPLRLEQESLALGNAVSQLGEHRLDRGSWDHVDGGNSGSWYGYCFIIPSSVASAWAP